MRSTGIEPRATRIAEWTGVLLAPAAFLTHLQLAYTLVPRACRYHDTLWLHVSGVASVALALVGLVAAWRMYAHQPSPMPTDVHDARPRERFMGAVGLGISSVLALLLLAQWLTVFVLSPCQ